MKIMRHIGLRLDSEEERTRFLDIGVEFTFRTKMPGGGIVAAIDLAEDDPRWRGIEALLKNHKHVLDVLFPAFSAADFDAAQFLQIEARANGYPQPEDVAGYLSATYNLTRYCQHCGVGKEQARPFRMKGAPVPSENSIFQLNWVPDEYFVARATWESVFKPMGLGMRSVTSHGTGAEIRSLAQLDISQVCELALEGVEHAECHFCGRAKYSPRFPGFHPVPMKPNASIFKSSQSFGTGAQAFKLVFVAASLYRRLKDAGFKVKFYPCGENDR